MVEASIPNGNEIGRIESVKHVEWLLVPFFIFFALSKQIISIEIFIIYLVGAQFPDILEGIFFKSNIEPEKRRLVSHTFLFPVILIILSYSYNPLLYYFSLSYFGHIIIDLFSGGDPVYLIGPFSSKIGGNIIHKENRLSIGEFVYNKVGYLWEENTNSDLAWFWILQFFGSVFGAIAFCIYLWSLN